MNLLGVFFSLRTASSVPIPCTAEEESLQKIEKKLSNLLTCAANWTYVTHKYAINAH